MGKEDVVHTHGGILLSHKKDEIMSFAAMWMDIEIIIVSEVSQTKMNTIFELLSHLYVEYKI